MNSPSSSEVTPDPQKKKLTFITTFKNIGIVAGAITAIGTAIGAVDVVLKGSIVTGLLETALHVLKPMDKDVNATQPVVCNVQKNCQLDLLSSVSINRVSHNFESKSVTSALIFPESTKNQLKKFPVKMIDLKIEFDRGQDSVIFWILDEQSNSIDKKLLKKDGGANSGNPNERSFAIAVGSLPRFDSDSISEIRIESRGLKSSSGSFAVKSLVMK